MSETLVMQMAASLNEPNIELLEKVVAVIGAERAEQIWRKALEVEASGGLMVKKGDRRRTPGGVFFHLVRSSTSGEERRTIFPRFGSGDRNGDGPRPPTPAQPPVKPATWGEALAIAVKLLSMPKGEVTVKMTLIGRPKQVGKQKGSIFCIMEGRGAPTALPKGLPLPPDNVKQNVVVFIAEKQWSKVEESLRDHKDDALIIEGWPYFDPARQMTVLLAQSTTTKLIQRSKRQGNANTAE